MHGDQDLDLATKTLFRKQKKNAFHRGTDLLKLFMTSDLVNLFSDESFYLDYMSIRS